jgi:hypothetical protein
MPGSENHLKAGQMLLCLLLAFTLFNIGDDKRGLAFGKHGEVESALWRHISEVRITSRVERSAQPDSRSRQ